MRKLLPKAILVLAILTLAVTAIIPPEKKLKLGKDLRGGASLIYAVQLKPGESPGEVMPKLIEVLKQRVDPDGLSEISIVQLGRDRIEITMPLPDKRVKALKQAFEDSIAALDRSNIPAQRLDRVMRLPPDERPAELSALSAGDARRAELLKAAAEAFDRAAAKRAEYQKAVADKAEQSVIDGLVDQVAQADLDYEKAKASVLKSSLSAAEVRRALLLSDETRSLLDNQTGKMISVPSPRQRALDRLRLEHPDAVAQLQAVIDKYEQYAQGRLLMDDPNDLVRQLKGAGVLDFRITVPIGYDPAEVTRLRAQLKERGPRNVRSTEVHWYKINQIRNWYNDVQQLKRLESDPVGFLAERRYIGAEYDGEYYILCWDTRGSRLTQAEGQWAVSRAFETRDEVGKPAIGFEMDPRGAVLLGELTRNHVQSQMAVLLDDQIYTAPTLQSAISNSGRITGEFPPEEVRYVIRVLSAGSLQAKLSPEPLSIQALGPQLGADNLRMGFRAGVIALLTVGTFMVVYYFRCGAVSVVALLCNSLLVLGAMALNKAAFTMPGIAGMILTFGMAVDSNVLIYERMREEIKRGADLKTAVRLGFDKALASIVDGNVTNLIVCVVLAQFGTQEVRGFAITMGIGVCATLFCAIVVSRLLIDVMVLPGWWKKALMLPMVIPALQRALEPHVNWLRLRWIFIFISVSYVGLGLYMVATRGHAMLDNEFRGGTQVTLQFKDDPAHPGQAFTLTRHDVEERVSKIGKEAHQGDPLQQLATAEVIPINPQTDGVTSDQFTIKTVIDTPEPVKNALTAAFADYLDAKPPIAFTGSEETDFHKAPVYRLNFVRLGENIDRPEARDDVSAYVGGLAIVLNDLQPPQKLTVIRERFRVGRSQPEFPGAVSRTSEIRALDGTDDQVRSAVILVRDEGVSFVDNEARFDTEVAEQEWAIARAAFTQTSTPASVQNFSAVIAQTFKAKAINATLISFLLIAIYIWVRFKTFRYAFAALIALLHDVLTVLGLIALCEIMYETQVTQEFARTLGILPFKIDLNMVAAMLTVAGYSLNDTIIIMDRIRENRGKMLHASATMINNAINQTISRTLITSGTTLMSCTILYLFGGEGVRAFAFALLTGIMVGTYSSIAVAAPIVWSRKMDTEVVA